jgi:hypothetical protein
MILIIIAAVLALIGRLIKIKKLTWLISGYNTASAKKKAQYDVDKLCCYVGNFVFVLAGILALTGAALLLTHDSDTVALIGLGVLMAAAVAGIIWLNTGGRLKKKT